MKLRKIAGSILFFIILIAFWQFLYVAATDWLGSWPSRMPFQILRALWKAQECF